jgi:hypothetical protein
LNPEENKHFHLEEETTPSILKELEEYSTPFEKKQNHTQAEEPTPLPPLSASQKD